MLTTILRRYQDFDPDTGTFVSKFRTLREYAALLGVNHATLSVIFNSDQEPGGKVMFALFETFPQAAKEYADALAAPDAAPAEAVRS